MSTIERVLFWDFEQFFDLALSFLVIKLTRRRILREKVFTKDVITLYGALHEHLLGGDINFVNSSENFLTFFCHYGQVLLANTTKLISNKSFSNV